MPDNDSRNDDLRDWLRRGDPAAGEPELPVEQVRQMRRQVLATVPEPRSSRFLPLAALTAAAALAAVLLLRPTPVTMEHETATFPTAPEAPQPTVRQVQFTTASGTRIVWTLDPDFDL